MKGHQGPTAVNTILGWVLSGPISTSERDEDDAVTLVTHVLKVHMDINTKRLDRRLQAFWDIESIGIVDREKEVYKQFVRHIQFKEGRYEVSLPWKETFHNTR